MTAGGATPRPLRRNPRPVPVSEALDAYLADSGLERALRRLGVLDEWAGLVGERIARVTRAAEVRGETLVVEVASSPWLNELTMMRHDILERINRSEDRPPVSRILFRLAEEPIRPRKTSRKTRDDDSNP